MSFCVNLNETMRVRTYKQKRMVIYIFDSNALPKEVDMTSLGKAEITFGRDMKNDIVLSSRLASRSHGKLSYSDKQWCVTDLGSTNGIIYQDKEITEVKIGQDDFIRIDDGVEAVTDGVLIIFASDEYSDTWETVSVAELGSRYDLNIIFQNIDAVIERTGSLFYLNVQNPNLYINKKAATGRILLHEKDVIACNDVRLVFTSNALYVNRLKVKAGVDSQPIIQEELIVDNIVESNMDSSHNDISYENSFFDEVQETPPFVNDQKSLDSNINDEAVKNEPIQQDVQYDNDYQKSYQNSSLSATSSGGGLRSFLASDIGYYVLSFIIAIIIWGIAVALWTSQGELALIVILACAIFGWQALNRIQPAMFIWMSWTGWIIYFCVKFILSAIIGLFVAPFKLGKLIAGAISGSMM